jgi:hypothetical protein
MTIEDIILDRDRRGIAALRPHLPEDYCGQAARLILEHPGPAIIVTGFYILAARATETDGPPGAVAIGKALRTLGYEVTYVTDRYTFPVMAALLGTKDNIVNFPIANDSASKEFAADLLAKIKPSVVVAIERCGLTNEGLYRNMRGLDITQFNARTDYLFTDHPHTVGIGDGGNEIGMGNLAEIVPTIPTLVRIPCITRTTKLVISSVSNWGGYGLVAALSRLRQKNLLPSVEEEQEWIKRAVNMGAVDGITTKQDYKVDGFTLEENSQTLQHLHEFLASHGV